MLRNVGTVSLSVKEAGWLLRYVETTMTVHEAGGPAGGMPRVRRSPGMPPPSITPAISHVSGGRGRLHTLEGGAP